MSTIIHPDGESAPMKNLNILSLDAGGPQGISQLMILKNVMELISRDSGGDSGVTIKRPCEVFHAIGGVGTGGLIAMFLVVLKMTAAQALEEFTDLVGAVFKEVAPDPHKQTKKLRCAIEGILERYGVEKSTELIASSQSPPACKLIVPIMYRNNVGIPCILRNYIAGLEPSTEITILESMLTTCATPPIFSPMNIEKDFSIFEYVGGDLGLSNPTREVIAEAHRAFGDDVTVACLLSIGSGHTGVEAVPQDSNVAAWVEFLDRVTKHSEKTAQEVAAQMKHLALYHRLSVDYGLEAVKRDQWKDLTVIPTATTIYLNDLEVSQRVQRCVDTINHGDGFATLEQLRHSGGAEVLSPAMPPLASHYVERKEATRFVENALLVHDGSIKPGSKILVVTGIGGCGKTQLIRKFVEQHGNKYITAFFIDGSSKGTFQSGLVRHVRSLGTAHSQKAFDDSMTFLSQPPPDGERILIIDNVDDPTIDLAAFLPRWPYGTVILTSRDRSRGQLGSAHLQLDVMSQNESVELLVRGWGRAWPPSESDTEAAGAVATELGCHPIALVQAISYISKTGHSAETYITRLRAFRGPLLNDPATNQVDMRYKTAFSAFDASFEILSTRGQEALHLLSSFHWQNFSLDLISIAAENNFAIDIFDYLPRGEEFEEAKRRLVAIFSPPGQLKPLALDSLIASLRSHSLVTVVSTGNSIILQMHPLVHEWARLRLPIDVSERFQSAAVRLLCCGAIRDNRSMMQFLHPHVQSLRPTWDGLHVNDASSFSFILHESGLYSDAANLRGNVREILKTKLGIDHLHTMGATTSLAETFRELGRYGEAEELQKEVLRRRSELLGLNHRDTVMASANLGMTYWKLGRYREAEELQKEVLRWRSELLGLNHPDTILASSNLGMTYWKQGRYREAEELQEEVLRQTRTLMGLGHLNTILAFENLASTYCQLGRYINAEEAQKEVLKRRSELMGVNHPDTILASSNLGMTYWKLGRYREAEELQKEVLRRTRDLMGVEHPQTVLASANLAATYCQQGRYRDAEEVQKEILRQLSELMGVDHPDTIMASANLAASYSGLGRYGEAEELLKEVLRRRRELMGVDHPDTIMASENLGVIYYQLRRYGDAEELQKEVLRRRSELLGADHPDTFSASANLAATYYQLRRYGDAEELQKEVLRRRSELMGVDHPDTLNASANLASSYSGLRRYDEAEELERNVLSKRAATLGERHPNTLLAMHNLACTYHAMQRYPEAIALARNATQMMLETLGEAHPMYQDASTSLVALTKETTARQSRRNRAFVYHGIFVIAQLFMLYMGADISLMISAYVPFAIFCL